MKKKFLVVMMISSFALSLIAQAANSGHSFPDIGQDSPYYGAVEYLKAKGVITGYPDGSFKADQKINRAEALKVALLAAQTPLNELQNDTKMHFPDVKTADWFASYVQKGFDQKIVDGYADGTFKPENNINVAESLKVIFRTFKVALTTNPSTENPFSDVDKKEWYAAYAQYGKGKQLIMALDDGKLHAEREITRGDFAEIVYRLAYVVEAHLDKFPLDKDWPTFIHPTDHYTLKYPFDWKQIPADDETIFWKQDKPNGQVSFARVFPNSATTTVVVDTNQDQLSLDQYLAKIQYDSSPTLQKMILNDYPFASLEIPTTGLRDFYFQLPNKEILIIYSQIGDGALKSQLQEEMRYLVGSVRYNEQGGQVSPDQLLSQIRANLLVKGKGQEMLKLLSDAIIINTDTIGIGTGPIDYYFSASVNVTIKYERNSDTLLAMKDGKTSAF